MAALPPDLDTVIEKAWQLTQRTAGFLGESEARFLGMLAACVSACRAIVEIASFKSKSTVMVASVAVHYGLGPRWRSILARHVPRQTPGLQQVLPRLRNFLRR